MAKTKYAAAKPVVIGTGKELPEGGQETISYEVGDVVSNADQIETLDGLLLNGYLEEVE